jgi:putative DNA primase/helicase
MAEKAHPDVNDTLRNEGPEGVRARHDEAHKTNGANGHQQSAEDAEIERLARLSAIQYEHERKEAAERLGVRAAVLDKLVEAERAKSGNGDDGKKQGHAISLPEPEPWPEPVAGAELLNEIAKAIRRHVVLSNHACDTCALWVLHTYLLDCFVVSPRLCARSPMKGCGKTTLEDVMGRLVLRPLPTANVTPAAIFRVVEAHRPTLLIDEADTFVSQNDELRGVLNSGHRKGGSVLRTVGDDHEPRSFATYSACVIALIGTLPDTLHDRSVVVELRRRLRSEAVEGFRPDRAGHLDVLARKAARWAKDNEALVAGADPDMAGLVNREADNWRPLLAIADAAGGKWPEGVRKAAEQAHEANGVDRLEVLLGDIRAIFVATNAQELKSAVLVDALVALEGHPWAEFGRSRKPLTQSRLARLLSPLPVVPEVIRFGNETPRGYRLAQFKDAFDRYLPNDIHADSLSGASEPQQRNKCDETGTSEPFQGATEGDPLRFGSATLEPEDLEGSMLHFETATENECCGSKTDEKANNDGLCCGVADESAEKGLCAQCHGPVPDAPLVTGPGFPAGGVYLHVQCRRFWTPPPSGIPFVITHLMKVRLRERGYSDAQIATLTPAEAHAALGGRGQEGKEPYTVLGPAPGGERCHSCGKGGALRIKYRGEVDAWHERCVDKHIAAMANPPVEIPDQRSDLDPSQKDELRSLGLTDEDIAEMTPEEAHAALRGAADDAAGDQ